MVSYKLCCFSDALREIDSVICDSSFSGAHLSCQKNYCTRGYFDLGLGLFQQVCTHPECFAWWIIPIPEHACMRFKWKRSISKPNPFWKLSTWNPWFLDYIATPSTRNSSQAFRVPLNQSHPSLPEDFIESFIVKRSRSLEIKITFFLDWINHSEQQAQN